MAVELDLPRPEVQIDITSRRTLTSSARTPRLGEREVCILNQVVQSLPTSDLAFAALSDATRRGILERLGRRDASISDLAGNFGMTLTGMKKHVRILEGAGLVTTEKVGRVRHCKLGPRRLENEQEWIADYQQMLEARLDRLGEFLERTKGSDL
jgi:DNA-binding transcriptional ArsR family regulator